MAAVETRVLDSAELLGLHGHLFVLSSAEFGSEDPGVNCQTRVFRFGPNIMKHLFLNNIYTLLNLHIDLKPTNGRWFICSSLNT